MKESKNVFNIQIMMKNRNVGLMGRVFANGPADGVQSQVESYQRLKDGT